MRISSVNRRAMLLPPEPFPLPEPEPLTASGASLSAPAGLAEVGAVSMPRNGFVDGMCREGDERMC